MFTESKIMKSSEVALAGRRQVTMALGGFMASLPAWSNPFARFSGGADGKKSRTPFVVVSALAPGAKPKSGLEAVTNTGARIFAKAELNERGGSTSSFGGTVPFPQWVQVTWRAPLPGFKIGSNGQRFETLDFGDVIGDFRVEVMSRIPDDLFTQAKVAPGRTIALHFLVTDDGVLLAWAIQEQGDPRRLFYGGDFKLPTYQDGKMVDPGYGIQR